VSAAPVIERPILEKLEQNWSTPRGWRGTLSSVDHKTIGLRYLVTSIAFLVIGGIEALLLRSHLPVIGEHLVSAGS
jgi:heme/copper-type cytochrome/quinol oxidase subunit 1